MEKSSKSSISLPVLSVTEGEHLGYVKNLVIDPLNKIIAAFVVNQKGWFKEDKIIPFNRVKNIGDNAIIIDKTGTAEKPSNLPQIIKYIKNPTQLINVKVVTTSGKALGHVDEFWFDITGKITKFEISGKFTEGLWRGKAVLLSEEVVTVGKDAIMVKNGAETRLIMENKQLNKTISELKSATVKAWDTTVQTSQKFGHAISSSINKLAEEEKKAKENSDHPEIPESSENPNFSSSCPEESDQKTREIAPLFDETLESLEPLEPLETNEQEYTENTKKDQDAPDTKE